MLKIIVLGSGLIPRGHGIAPCHDPFETDLDTIKLIMNTKGMAPYAVSRRDGHKIRLTYSNLDRVLRMADFNSDYTVQETKKDVTPLQPVVPKPKFESVEIKPEPVVAVEKVEEKPVEAKVEDKVEEQPKDENSNDNGNYYNKKKDKHNNNSNNNNSNNQSFKPINNPNEN